ncbi:MAG: 1-hydroxycarotenoid 3,4-desaturase CrtD [Pseudomonadota bacterium]
MGEEKAIIIGAGAGGLAAAIDLARTGIKVDVFEAAAESGGKIHQAFPDGQPMDAGPTVFTMRWVFEQLFDDAGADLQDTLSLQSANLLARHAWQDGGTLDLFANRQKSADAIRDFAGPDEADGYLKFCQESANIYEKLRGPFIQGQRPSPLEVISRVGLLNMPSFIQNIKPMQTLWKALSRHFKDDRLRQLFGRYATYVGSSPYHTPATIMLVAHVEQEGVWAVDGGMKSVAIAMQNLGEKLGAEFHFNTPVKNIITKNSSVTGVHLENGDEHRADIIVFNGDSSALAMGMLGDDIKRAARAVSPKQRSLSAVTYCMHSPANGFPLAHHNVFFADDYAKEFQAIFDERRITDNPTVYLCAQDRGAENDTNRSDTDKERLFLLINAPADGDLNDCRKKINIEQLTQNVDRLLQRCGLEINFDESSTKIAQPSDFHNRFPASGGALYGQTCHGMMATMERAGARTPVAGLYLAGGSVHPGAGVPMATMSGRLAAQAYMQDRSRRISVPQTALGS